MSAQTREKLIIDLPDVLSHHSKTIENGCLVQLLFSEVEYLELRQLAIEDEKLKAFVAGLTEVDDNGANFYAHVIENPVKIREVSIKQNGDDKVEARRESRARHKATKKRKLDVINGVIDDPELKASLKEEEVTKLLEREAKKRKYAEDPKVKNRKKTLALRTSKAMQMFKKDYPEKWKAYQMAAEKQLVGKNVEVSGVVAVEKETSTTEEENKTLVDMIAEEHGPDEEINSVTQ